jgi:Mg2+/citrate symporter
MMHLYIFCLWLGGSCVSMIRHLQHFIDEKNVDPWVGSVNRATTVSTIPPQFFDHQQIYCIISISWKICVLRSWDEEELKRKNDIEIKQMFARSGWSTRRMKSNQKSYKLLWLKELVLNSWFGTGCTIKKWLLHVGMLRNGLYLEFVKFGQLKSTFVFKNANFKLWGLRFPWA